MKTYKIDPLKKQRPLMLFRGTRIPEVFPDTVAEQLINSLNENSRGFIVGIDGEARFVNAQGNPLCMFGRDYALAMFNESNYDGVSSMTWEDTNGQQSKIECNRVTKGSQYNGADTYYTGPYKDLKNFVRNVIPYTGQPLTTGNCRQWFSYTTPEGVALTFRGCIQAKTQAGEYAGLKIDKIELRHSTVSGSTQNISEDLCITLDCTESVLLGGLNGMVGSMPANLNPGIGWLQIVSTDEFKSHIKGFNEAVGNGDARIDPYEAYDGFTYNIAIGGIFTDYNDFRTPTNMASCRIKVKENSALCNSTIVDKVGYAAEHFGFNRAYPVDSNVYDDINPVLDGDSVTVDVGLIFEKLVVIDLPNVNSNDQYLHISIPETVVDHSSIRFITTDGRKVGEMFPNAGDTDVPIPARNNVFAFFFFTDMNGTASVQFSRVTKQSEPVKTPGFYSADGNLIKSMSKEEVETDYTDSTAPAVIDESIKNATEFVWPEGVTKIGEFVFSYCDKLASVTIPDGVTSIGMRAFCLCSALTSVTIPDGVTSIGGSAFAACYALTSVTIPDGVTSIGGFAFNECSALESVALPSTLTSIEQHTFQGCTSLTSVTIPEGVTTIGGYAFRDCTGLTSVTLPNTLTSIGFSVFRNCTKLTSVTIPDGVTSIEGSAFRDCTGLTSVTIPSTVTSIGSSTFQGCKGLTSVTLPNTLTSIGQQAFSDCSGLTSITIPSTVTSIGDNAFSLCSGLTSVTIPEGVTSISNSTFYECTGLTSVTIPEGVTSIGRTAFSFCSGLTSLTIPSTVTSIGVGAFSKSGLTSVTIPEGVTTIGNDAFRGCSSLTSVTIPSTVTSIGNSAFNGCTGLTSITIPSTVTSIDGYAFYGCTALNSLTVPNTVTSIGNDAFKNVPKVIYNGSATGSPWGALEVAAS